MGLTTSDECLKQLRTIDACITKPNGTAIAYKDSNGTLCIGYGWHGTINGKAITNDTEITRSTVERLFNKRVHLYENRINKYYPVYKWNQNQFDALMIYCWNKHSLRELLLYTNKGIMITSRTKTIDEISNDLSSCQYIKKLFNKPYTLDDKPNIKRVDISGERITCHSKPDVTSDVTGKISNRTRVVVLEEMPDTMFYKVKAMSVRGKQIIGYCEKRYFR